jgi:hypothetical protein
MVRKWRDRPLHQQRVAVFFLLIVGSVIVAGAIYYGYTFQSTAAAWFQALAPFVALVYGSLAFLVGVARAYYWLRRHPTEEVLPAGGMTVSGGAAERVLAGVFTGIQFAAGIMGFRYYSLNTFNTLGLPDKTILLYLFAALMIGSVYGLWKQFPDALPSEDVGSIDARSAKAATEGATVVASGGWKSNVKVASSDRAGPPGPSGGQT